MAGTAGGGSVLLENCIDSLQLLGFEVFPNYPAFKKAGDSVGDKYIVRSYPHDTIWGTTGRKEGIIVSPQANDLAPSQDGLYRCVVEAKFQQVDGSVDEKIPFLWLSFLESDIPNWIIVFDGAYWTKRAKAEKVLGWLKNKAQGAPINRRLIVVEGVRAFYPLVMKTWEK